MSRNKALIIDDEVLIRMMEADTVQEVGLDVIECGDAEAALDYLSKPTDANEVCLVVTDVQMPGMNGVELAQHIAEHFPWIHLIITSGWHASLGQRPPKAEFLPKPWPIARLAQIVKKAQAEC
jgi:DNA-binding NtrC family response regulator